MFIVIMSQSHAKFELTVSRFRDKPVMFTPSLFEFSQFNATDLISQHLQTLPPRFIIIHDSFVTVIEEQSCAKENRWFILSPIGVTMIQEHGFRPPSIICSFGRCPMNIDAHKTKENH